MIMHHVQFWKHTLIDDVGIKNEEVAPFKDFGLKVYYWNLCNHCSTCYVCSFYN